MTRHRISLDGEWEFFPDPDQSLSPASLSGGKVRRIQVPGPWQAQFDDLRDYSGMAWYRKGFRLDESPRHSGHGEPPVWIIHFGAVDYYAAVYLNGTLIGEHEGGYLPFEFEFTDTLHFKESNELVIQVIDPGNAADVPERFPFAEIPHGKQSWYGPVGGLWQSVYIEARHPVHIRRVRLTPEVPQSRVHLHVRLSGPAAVNQACRVTVTHPTGSQELLLAPLTAGSEVFEQAVVIAEPMLWDIDHPHLYQFDVELVSEGDGGPPLDRVTEQCGMRTITTSSHGHLVLNGQVLYLRGALDQDYYPEMIYTPFSDTELEAQFLKARHMGLNCLRTHIKITDPRYYAAADRVGLLIWTELPNWQDLTEPAKRRASETLAGMVERDWNHPSIIIWTIINEGWGVDLAVNPGHREWLAETYSYLKSLDPTRLVVGNSPCFTNFHVVTDIEDFHNYYAMPDHYRDWRDWVRTFAGRPPWTFAHVVENIEAWREFVRDPWNPVPRQPAAEVQRTGNEPMVVSEFGNWGLPDVSLLRECYGGREPWWFETGIEWGDGVVYPHGVEQRYRAFHLDKVFPTLSDLSAASQRAQFAALKYQIEEMRRHPNIVGYIITEFTDVHWESNGLLDMCRNPKTYYDVIGQVNSPDVIVPEWERVAFWEGERCEVRLLLSHFSSADLRGSRLEWHLHGHPAVRGSLEQLNPQRAQATTLGTVVFPVPPLEASQRDRLEFTLLAADGAAVAHNHHELYFFPRHNREDVDNVRLYAAGLPRLSARLRDMGYAMAATAESADVMVVETLTDEARWFIQRGGRVLWLAESSDSLQTYVGSLGIAQRSGRSWQGDWASSLSWIRSDRVFGDIPTGGLIDFAFADLTPDTVIVGLSPRDFASHVYSGLCVGWIHHTVALVAERAIDKGRVLISTFRLRDQLGTHPVATIMMRDMIRRLVTADGTPERANGQDSPPDLNRLAEDEQGVKRLARGVSGA